MSKDDLMTFTGQVSDLSGGGVYHINLDNGVRVKGRLCGKMKKFNIKIVVGDTVSISLSPYDPTHGLITHRHKMIRAT
jgi:translation initiation factor IF-1